MLTISYFVQGSVNDIISYKCKTILPSLRNPWELLKKLSRELAKKKREETREWQISKWVGGFWFWESCEWDDWPGVDMLADQIRSLVKKTMHVSPIFMRSQLPLKCESSSSIKHRWLFLKSMHLTCTSVFGVSGSKDIRIRIILNLIITYPMIHNSF